MLNTQSLAPKPSIKELGIDLLVLSKFQLFLTLVQPFIFFTLYFVFAINDYWVLATLSTMGLSFTSYGSTSHDLVHENLRLKKSINTILLSILELLCLRSGHAYRLSHLYHHKRFPHDDDVEGAASRMTLIRTLIEGVIFQFKIYLWALSQSRETKYFRLILIEGAVILFFFFFCMYTLQYTYIYVVYMCLMIAGSWIIPLVTSYAVHTPDGPNELNQTRLFRGSFFSIIAFGHLYHLEHHLYPMVPHKNWPKLAKRLDGYFKKHCIKPIEFTLMKP
jgi:beta-carotene hydroxylase